MKTQLKHIWLLAMMALITGLFCACESKGKYIDDDDDDKPSKPKQVLKYAALNVSDTTKGGADIFFVCSDNSYMTFDVNYKDSCGVLYFNGSMQNELDSGIFIYVDKTGTPTMLKTSEGEYYFENVTENGCDIGFRNNKGEVRYFWNVQPGQAEEAGIASRKARNSWGEIVTGPFTAWWNEVSSFDWTWDEHQRKAILPFAAKVASFGITAVQIVMEPNLANIGGGIITLYEEAAKSGLVDTTMYMYCEIYDYAAWILAADDDFKFVRKGFTGSQFGLATLSAKLGEYADNALENIATFNGEHKDVFDHPELQIQLSTYRIEATPMGGNYTVEVMTQSYWYPEMYGKVDWLRYTVDEEYKTLFIEVDQNEGEQSRYAYIKLHSYAEEAVPAVLLTIAQDGVAFSLSETSMTFKGEKDYKILYVYTNSEVKDWKVKESPRWLECTKEGNTVFCETKSSFSGSFGEMAEGNIVIEATFTDGSKATKSCAVQWLPDEGNTSWDGTSWVFSGHVNFSDNSGGDLSMGLAIHSVASHSASLTLMSTPNIPCSVSEDSSHSLTGTFAYGGVMTGSFTVTRTGETTATCVLSMSGPGENGGIVTGGGTLTGTKQ